MNCKICNKELTKNQKSTCSLKCRSAYVNSLNKGRYSPFKGKSRWTEEQRKKIGDVQRGIPKSEEFSKKCSERMKGKAFFKGHKQSEYQKSVMRNMGKEKHYNWKGGITSDKSTYTISLRRKKNGFSPDLFESRMKEQNGLCAICGIMLESGLTSKAASADHDHETGKARGILCKRCNLMLGQVKDDIALLEKAIIYLYFWKRTA